MRTVVVNRTALSPLGQFEWKSALDSVSEALDSSSKKKHGRKICINIGSKYMKNLKNVEVFVENAIWERRKEFAWESFLEAFCQKKLGAVQIFEAGFEPQSNRREKEIRFKWIVFCFKEVSSVCEMKIVDFWGKRKLREETSWKWNTANKREKSYI